VHLGICLGPAVTSFNTISQQVDTGGDTSSERTQKGRKHMTHNLSKLAQFCSARILLSWRRQLVIGAFCSLAMLTTARAQMLELLSSKHAGTAYVPAIAELKDGWVVTALCNGSNNLEVIVWQDAGAGLVRKSSHKSASECFGVSVAISPFNSSTVVTAVVDTVGAVELAAWQVSSTGSISQLGTTATLSSASGFQEVSIAQLDATRVVTALVDLSNSASVTSWLVPSTGDIKMEGGASLTGSFDWISVAGLNSTQVVTASSTKPTTTTNPGNDLGIIAWSIDSDGNVTQQPGSATAGYAETPEILLWNSNQVVTAFQNGALDLELITWTVNSAGTVTRQYTGAGGRIAGGVNGSQVALCIMPSEGPFTAVLSPDGTVLDVELWEKSGSKLVEFRTYDTAFSYAPTSCSPINTNEVVTASYYFDGNPNHDLELNEWGLVKIP